ncbi:ABC transporter ced-7-like [Oppia nitens]|uniref:ABC transporter ced-7-like n=1 Tax=Oppia nitens TaxID=1686743 RepID=UPI0023DC2B4C|nr:ABC transporter ced-7-like [Oppia nitens]
MSALLWKQFVILIWKSCIIRRRHWLSAIFELLTPIALSLAIAYLYYKGQTLAQENSKPIANDKTTLKPTEQDVEASHSAENRWVDPTYYDKPTIKEKFDSYTAYLKIFYCPDNDVAKALTGQLSAFGLKVKGFESETELKNKLEAMLTDDKEKDGFRWNFGLILDTDGISKGRLNYTIRQFGRMAEDVHRLFPEKYKPGPIEMKEIQIYTYFGELQILVNQAFVNLKLNNTSNGTADNTTSILNIKEVETYLYPYPKYKKISTNEDIKFSMQEVVAGIIVIGYVVLCPLIVKRITDEKAAKAKEMLRMIGMSDWVFWSSHFVSFFIVMVFHSIHYFFSYTYHL